MLFPKGRKADWGFDNVIVASEKLSHTDGIEVVGLADFRNGIEIVASPGEGKEQSNGLQVR